MRLPVYISRLAAFLVLLSAGCDFCAFDLYDPDASMSQPGPVMNVDTANAICPAAMRTSDLPDDHCLCCSPTVASQVATLASPFLISSAPETRAIQPTIPEARIIERPPRS
jgi:hypothetical protein